VEKTLYVGIDADLLNEYISASGLKIGFIVEKLGISRQAFARKLKGKISFKASEVYTLCDILRISEDDKKDIFCSKT
jgi:predicted transcriptional regulator